VFDRLPSEDEQIAEEAREARRLTPAQRVELFISIMQMIGNTWQSLPFAEQWRRLGLAEAVDGPRPVPWWSGMRADRRP
jgi:hypothetical protein